MNDRGVSEALGFVLVFALITGTVGIVYATGISGLQDAQEAEKLNNVGRAFDVLADNVEDLYSTGAPSRATEVKLAGGSIGTAEPMTVEIRAENSSDPLHNETYIVVAEPIIYRDGSGTSILYVQGAVLRSEAGGAAMLSEPDWIAGRKRAALPLITTYGDGGEIAGSGTALVVTEGRTHSLDPPFSVNGSSTAVVNVTVTSPRVDAWKQYFIDRGYDPVDASVDHGNVTYQFETETLYVPKTGVRVTINR